MQFEPGLYGEMLPITQCSVVLSDALVIQFSRELNVLLVADLVADCHPVQCVGTIVPII